MTARPGKRADLIIHDSQPFNAESRPDALAAAAVTPVDTFYVRSHGPVPPADPTLWRVHVDGLVQRPLELSLDELRERFEPRRLVATLQCAGNRRAGLIAVREIPGEAPWGPGAIGTARWGGVALADVLRRAGLRAEARHIALTGADVSEEADPPQPFGASIPREKALAEEVLLAWEMNGAPLAPDHGAPLRAIVPGYIGARSVKWLERITAQTDPSRNYFQDVAYRLLPAEGQPAPGAGMALGAVAVNAEILEPRDGAAVRAGRLGVSGYAVSGDDRRIVRVDLSADGGRHWQQAELLEDLGPWAWTRWHAEVEVAPGARTEIIARAWDSAAGTQPESAAALWNPKGYVNNSWARVTVTPR